MSDNEGKIKVVAEILKEGTAYDDAVKGFLHKAIGGPLEQMGMMMSEFIAYRRARNLAKFHDKLLDAIDKSNINEEHIKSLSPGLVMKIVGNSSMEEAEEVLSYAANLLVNSSNPKFGFTLQPAFVKHLSEIDAFSTRLVSYLYYRDIEGIVEESSFLSNSDADEFDSSIHNLIRMRIVLVEEETSTEEIIQAAEIGDQEKLAKIIHKSFQDRSINRVFSIEELRRIRLSGFGLRFASACVKAWSKE
ncbi:MAG: Abi-alpha family protein [Pseudomonadota bacterium]